MVRAETSAQKEGRPEEDVDAPSTAGAWRATLWSFEVGRGACCGLTTDP